MQMVALALLPAAALCFVPALRVAPTGSRTSVSVPVVAARESALAALHMSSDVEEICGVLPPEVCYEVEAEADAVFVVIDTNGDGSISKPEIMAHLTKAGYSEVAVNTLFTKLDSNNDGEISKEELRAGFLKYSPLRSAPGLGGYNSEFVDEIHQDADALFAAIDSDGNGSISKDELREHLKTFSKYSFKAISKIFKMLDVNKDGSIEKEELRNAFVQYSALRQAIGDGPNHK